MATRWLTHMIIMANVDINTLNRNPEQDVLTGIYHQAVLNQAFEVVSVREN